MTADRYIVMHLPNEKHMGAWAIVDTACHTWEPHVVGRAMTRQDAEARARARCRALVAKAEIDRGAAA